MTTKFQVLALLVLAATPVTAESKKALVIGVTNYQNYTDSPIHFAHADALSFQEFLESKNGGQVKVKRLINEKATREAIWGSVRELRNEPNRPDTLIVFFSGHAELDSDTQELYLMPTGGDRARLSETGIPAKEFINTLRAVGPAHLLIFLDACHTGAVLLGKGGQDESVPGSLNALVAELNKGNEGGVTVFVSATKDERSWEDENLGIFTRFLIKGLQGAADGVEGDKDGLITTAELQNFLTREVPSRARALGHPAQHPLISPDFKGGYVIATVPISSSSSNPGIVSRPNYNYSALQKLRLDNPELALMVYLGSFIGDPSSSWTSENIGAIEYFEAARPVKVATLPSSIKPESLIGAVISSDGALLVACLSPTTLVSISLRADLSVHQSSIPSLPTNNLKREILDWCEISISEDRRFALVNLHFIDGASRLTNVGISSEVSVLSQRLDDYHSGTFVGNTMLLGKGNTVAIASPTSAEKRLVLDLPLLTKAVLSDQESEYFFVIHDHDEVIELRKMSDPQKAHKAPGPSSAEVCYPTADILYCSGGDGGLKVVDAAINRSLGRGSYCPSGVLLRGFQ